MLKYAILEIGGGQYKLTPGQPLKIETSCEPGKTFEAPILMLVEDGKIRIGKPYIKDKLELKCLEVLKGEKIRVAKFHAKANYRKVKGYRASLAKVIWDVKK